MVLERDPVSQQNYVKYHLRYQYDEKTSTLCIKRQLFVCHRDHLSISWNVDSDSVGIRWCEGVLFLISS